MNRRDTDGEHSIDESEEISTDPNFTLSPEALGDQHDYPRK